LVSKIQKDFNMKITVKQLKQLIKEQVEEMSGQEKPVKAMLFDLISKSMEYGAEHGATYEGDLSDIKRLKAEIIAKSGE